MHVTDVGPKHGDLTLIEVGCDDQPIQAVGFDGAVEQPGERVADLDSAGARRGGASNAVSASTRTPMS